ncbi:MAG: glycosyltransferase [Thermoplasmatota archaeon]
MRIYRLIALVAAFFAMIPLLIIPAYIGLTVSNGTLELTGYQRPDTAWELLTFRVLDAYYFLFLMVSIYPFIVLVLWSFIARIQERRIRSNVSNTKNWMQEKPSDIFFKDRFPKVSVIIPCYNEDRYLGSAIANIYKQSYQGEIEVVVVDDGSRDNTWSIGRIFRSKKGKRTTNIYHKENGGKASALKYGIDRAAGKIIIMTDGDSEMDNDAVREIVETFRRYPDAGIVGGFVSIKNSHEGYLTKVQQLEYYITQHIIRTNQSMDGSVLIAPGPIFGMRADLASSMPPLDRTIVEDCDLTMSILPTGFTTRATTRSVSYTNAPSTWSSWLRQRKRWIYGQFQAWRVNRWHLKKNPWGLFTYFTWVTTSISAIVFIIGLLWTLSLIITGSDYYSFLEFISLRTVLIFLLYFITRSMIVISYRQTRFLILYLPLKILYDMVNGMLTAYLYIRYITGVGVKMRWGNRQEVVY